MGKMEKFGEKTKRACTKRISLKGWLVVFLILLVAIFLTTKRPNNNFEKHPQSYDGNATNNKSEDHIEKDSNVEFNSNYNTKAILEVLSPEAINSKLVALPDASSQLEGYNTLDNSGYTSNLGVLVQKDAEEKDLPIACINEFCVYVEIANTNELRQKGLSSRESLSMDSGMLFVFEEPGHPSFWMKDMQFPLDMIWIGQDGRVLYIKNGALPCGFECPTVSPPKTEEFLSKYVLEVNAGLSEIYNFSIGDFVKIKI